MKQQCHEWFLNQNRGNAASDGVAHTYNFPDYWHEAAIHTDASLKQSSLMFFQARGINPK